MDKYHILEFIGEGSFAKVHRGRKKYTGQVSSDMIRLGSKLENEKVKIFPHFFR